MNLKLWQVDAFAAKPLEGNPAAIVPLEAWLDAGLMQKIANENNLAETAFFVRRGQGPVRICAGSRPSRRSRSLRPRDAGQRPGLMFEFLDPELKQVAFETRSGTLTVERGAGRLPCHVAAVRHRLGLRSAGTGASRSAKRWTRCRRRRL